MTRKEYQGKTLAFKRFKNMLWKTEKLLDLGVVGIDETVQKEISPLLEKFKGIKGVIKGFSYGPFWSKALKNLDHFLQKDTVPA